jgi:hypothetical protein
VQENRWKNRTCERFKFLIYKFEFGIGLIPPSIRCPSWVGGLDKRRHLVRLVGRHLSSGAVSIIEALSRDLDLVLIDGVTAAARLATVLRP